MLFRPQVVPRPHRRKPGFLRTSVFLTLTIGLSAGAMALDGIKPVQENGRTIFVNDESPAEKAAVRAATTSASTHLVYWSNTEHRWKPVPTPSPAAMSAARNAMAEVKAYIASRPRSVKAATYMSPNYRRVAAGYAVSSADIDKAIVEAATRHDVDPNLVRAIIKVESNFNAQAVSRKGAMGLMQLMPSTARANGVTNPFDPQQNVDAGVRHLKQLLTNYNGDVKLSLAAYNAGAGAVARNNGIPPYVETQNYVRRITDLYTGGMPAGSRLLPGKSAPIKMIRKPNGVLSFSNTE